jgi:hypothetical protein
MRFKRKSKEKSKKSKKLKEAKHRQDLDALTKMRIKEGLREPDIP